MRIDRLRELVAYHSLEALLPNVLKPEGPSSDWGPDPRLNELRRAVSLARKHARYEKTVDTTRPSIAATRRWRSFLIMAAHCWNEARATFSTWVHPGKTSRPKRGVCTRNGRYRGRF